MAEQKLELEERKEPGQRRKGVAWGLGAAFIGSLCCVGPVVAVAMGLGSASLLLGFAAYRPHFLGASFLLMGAGAFVVLRSSRTCHTQEDQRRSLWMYLAATVVTFALGYGLLTYVLPGLAYGDIGISAPPISAGAEQGQNPPNLGGGSVSAQGLRQAVLEIRGMT